MFTSLALLAGDSPTGLQVGDQLWYKETSTGFSVRIYRVALSPEDRLDLTFARSLEGKRSETFEIACLGGREEKLGIFLSLVSLLSAAVMLPVAKANGRDIWMFHR